VYWSAGVSLITDIPKKGHWPVKTHIFINAGRLDSMDKCLCFPHIPFYSSSSPFILFTAKSLKDNIIDSMSKPSISAGVGLIYRFDPVRVEANFGVPLVASKSDGSRRGFQVGIGLDFL
jgi:outer membrane protein insertion porin family